MSGVKFTSIALELKRSVGSHAWSPIIRVAFIDSQRSGNFHNTKK
jgi:hypothetical protein